MVRLVGGSQAREFLGVGFPVEVAAVDDCPSDARGVAVHIFCGGVGHDIGPPFEGAAVDGSGESVVDYKRHAMLVGHPGKLLNVKHVEARVGDCLSEKQLRIRAESCGYLLF